MNLFYTPDIDTDNEADRRVNSGRPKLRVLNEEESRHCIKVLRLQEGNVVYLVDGKGGFYTARIADANPKRCALEVTGVQREFRKRPYRLHVAIAPTKNIDRFEWFLEKATEAGIDEITPLICARSERRILRTDRLIKRITAAVKQSLHAYHPVLNEPAGFAEFIARFAAGPEASAGELLKCIAHCGEGPRQYLGELAAPGRDVLALIGPEGDFTPEEVEDARQRGFIPLGLGESRLRTETAGLAVCFEMSFLNRANG